MDFDIDLLEATTAESQAYAFLATGIRTGRFQPSQRLIPEVIAEMLGMSRMPVREAFRRLASEGLVVIRANRGCVVSRLSKEDIQETFEMRAVLEGLAARISVSSFTDEAIADLRNTLYLMNNKNDSRDDGWIDLHREFHLKLYNLSGRPRLIRQIKVLHFIIEPYLRVYFHHSKRDRNTNHAHKILVDAFETRNPALVEELVKAHSMETISFIAEV